VGGKQETNQDRTNANGNANGNKDQNWQILFQHRLRLMSQSRNTPTLFELSGQSCDEKRICSLGQPGFSVKLRDCHINFKYQYVASFSRGIKKPDIAHEKGKTVSLYKH
jgi:hypothetical protein